MDLYRILKVSPDAPDEVIRAAYKVLASKYHPDKNTGNAQAARTMQHVNDAYALLSDPIRRREYDRTAQSNNASPAPEQARTSVKKVTIHCRNCSCALRVPEEVLSIPGNYSVICPDCHQDPFVKTFNNTGKKPYPPKSMIDCKHCGQAIRVLSEAIHHPDRFEVTCPKCSRNPLSGPREHRYEQKPIYKPPINKLKYVRSLFVAVVELVKVGIVIAVVIGGLSAVFDSFSKKQTNQAQTSPSPTSSRPTEPTPTPKFFQPVQTLPRTGENTSSFVDGIAPLTIKTSSSGDHYFVKIISAGTGQKLGSYFIRSGETLNIQVPVGIYELKYASGRQWYGTNYLFGPDTNYNKADSLFNFSFDGYQYSGYTVELITQSNGNLHTSRLPPSQW